MKQQPLKIASFFLALSGSFSQGAAITWSVDTITDINDVSTNGSLVEAFNAAGSGVLSDHTVNEALFIGNADLFDGNIDNTGPFFVEDTGDEEYNSILRALDFGGGTNFSITVGGGALVAGNQYEIQIWYTQANAIDRNMIFGDGEAIESTISVDGNVGNISGSGFGQFATGTFTADGTEQTITLVTDGMNNTQFNAYQLRALQPSSTPVLSIDPINDTAELKFTWNANPGKVYNILSSVTLDSDPSTWPPVAGAEEIDASEFITPHPSDQKRFYVLQEIPTPPIYAEDFENGQGAWTSGNDAANPNTLWALGAPSLVGPTTGANGSANCFGTNLSSNYGSDANAWLQSPIIDLTNVSSATLHLQHFVDIEAGFDSGSIKILDADAANSEIAIVEEMIDGADTDWKTFTAQIPSAAIGKRIILEFRLSSNDAINQSGWYIDNLEISAQ